MSPAWRWEATDRHRPWTWLAMLALAGGVGLAVLGLPAVDWHGPLHYFGIMDPLCGATRGVRLTLRGDLVGAWRHNPAAPALVAGAVLVVLRGIAGRATGRWLTVERSGTRRTLLVVGVLVPALWVNQQAHAALLLSRP